MEYYEYQRQGSARIGTKGVKNNKNQRRLCERWRRREAVDLTQHMNDDDSSSPVIIDCNQLTIVWIEAIQLAWQSLERNAWLVQSMGTFISNVTLNKAFFD